MAPNDRFGIPETDYPICVSYLGQARETADKPFRSCGNRDIENRTVVKVKLRKTTLQG